MNFKTTATITAVVALVLGAGYLLAGHLVVGRWQIEPTESVLLFGRRIGAVYLGLSAMFFLARSEPPSRARAALCAGACVALSLLAGLGAYEFSAGRAARGILASAAVEGLLALAYLRLLLADRRPAVPA